MNQSYAYYRSPIGTLKITADHDSILAIEMFKSKPSAISSIKISSPILKEAVNQLKEYFSGKRNQFSLPIGFQGTDFQNKVWRQLLKIPYGTTLSYLDMAKKIKQPTAARAVGMALNKNPIAIVVPCHRVIGSNGTLTGFAGGISKKKFLLELEKD
ncbi:MAG: methylated-DNA--[protein]-cysteine S-methyltransferase [Candidatus Berkiellales bacterium]